MSLFASDIALNNRPFLVYDMVKSFKIYGIQDCTEFSYGTFSQL
jgi:hypothetical protein